MNTAIDIKTKWQPANLLHPNQPVSFFPESWEDLLFVGKGNLLAMRNPFRKEEERLKRQLASNALMDGGESDFLADLQSKIHLLTFLADQAEPKPFFPSFRSASAFQDVKQVVCFVGDPQGVGIQKICKEDWVTGTRNALMLLSNGPFHEIRFDIEVYGGVQGKYRRYAVRDPRLLSREDFEYLSHNDKYLILWAENVAPSLAVPHLMLAYLMHDIPLGGKK